MTFGKRLRNARITKGITQKQLADVVSAKHNSISNWENDINKPDPDTIELLCGVLEITPNYLLAADPGDFSPAEKLLIKQYRSLNDHGKDMVDTVLEKEYAHSQAYEAAAVLQKTSSLAAKKNKEHLIPVATHERTDIDVTDEMRQNDNDLMNDDNLWK